MEFFFQSDFFFFLVLNDSIPMEQTFYRISIETTIKQNIIYREQTGKENSVCLQEFNQTKCKSFLFLISWHTPDFDQSYPFNGYTTKLIYITTSLTMMMMTNFFIFFLFVYGPVCVSSLKFFSTPKLREKKIIKRNFKNIMIIIIKMAKSITIKIV